MFATLVIVLPSSHQGGELNIRHGDREVSLNLTPADVSEITYAAIYADCQHEVRPITKGKRLCLVYNLIQRPAKGRKKKSEKALKAPDYTAEIAKTTKMLQQWQAQEDAPPKLAYLLEHQYSPSGLSFSGLKNKDAALATVLAQAAEQAGCDIHLGILHIEESGPAEPDFRMPPRRHRSRFSFYDDDEVEEGDVSDGDFEIVEISEWEHYISDRVNLKDQPAKIGKVPLEEGELLPAGCLEDEPPDEQRVTEATGNEGASFERAYHRAALVLWPRHRYAEVLMQIGISDLIPYLKDR